MLVPVCRGGIEPVPEPTLLGDDDTPELEGCSVDEAEPLADTLPLPLGIMPPVPVLLESDNPPELEGCSVLEAEPLADTLLLPLGTMLPVPVLPVLYGVETGPVRPAGRTEGSDLASFAAPLRN